MARAQATPIPMRCIPNGTLIVGLLCGGQFVNRISVSDKNWLGVRSYVLKHCKQKDRLTEIGTKGKVRMNKFLCRIPIVRQEHTVMAEPSPRMKMAMGRAFLFKIYSDIFRIVSGNEMRRRMT
jgi:hypothetical protein